MQCPGASSLARVIVGGHPLSVRHLQSGPNTLSLGCHGGWRPTEGTKEPSDRVPGVCHPPCSGVAAQAQTRSPGVTAEVSSRRLFPQVTGAGPGSGGVAGWGRAKIPAARSPHEGGTAGTPWQRGLSPAAASSSLPWGVLHGPWALPGAGLMAAASWLGRRQRADVPASRRGEGQDRDPAPGSCSTPPGRAQGLSHGLTAHRPCSPVRAQDTVPRWHVHTPHPTGSVNVFVIEIF